MPGRWSRCAGRDLRRAPGAGEKRHWRSRAAWRSRRANWTAFIFEAVTDHLRELVLKRRQAVVGRYSQAPPSRRERCSIEARRRRRAGSTGGGQPVWPVAAGVALAWTANKPSQPASGQTLATATVGRRHWDRSIMKVQRKDLHTSTRGGPGRSQQPDDPLPRSSEARHAQPARQRSPGRLADSAWSRAAPCGRRHAQPRCWQPRAVTSFIAIALLAATAVLVMLDWFLFEALVMARRLPLGDESSPNDKLLLADRYRDANVLYLGDSRVQYGINPDVVSLECRCGPGLQRGILGYRPQADQDHGGSDARQALAPGWSSSGYPSGAERQRLHPRVGGGMLSWSCPGTGPSSG